MELGLRASWWQLTDSNWPLSPSQGGPSVGQRKERIPTGYIIEGKPLPATKVNLDTLPRLPDNHEFLRLMSRWNRGCH